MHTVAFIILISFGLIGYSAPAAADDQKICFNRDPGGDTAISACARLIASKKLPNNHLSVAHNWRATHLEKKGNFDRAIADYSEAIRLNEKNASAYNNRGLAFSVTGDYNRAITDLDVAIRLDPELAVARANRGLVYNKKGEYDRAIADFSEAIRLNSRYGGALFHRGLAYERKRDFPNALSDYRTVVRLSADDKYAAEGVSRMEKKLAAGTAPKQTALPPAAAQTSQPLPPPSTAVETRIALVIGNSTYANFGALTNPANDAKAIVGTLKRIGFANVTLQLDLPREKLVDALKNFARQAEQADWALIYFAGHGFELGGVNYLVPVDAKLSSDREAFYEAVQLEQVLQAVGGARKIGVVILDACRDNPFIKTMTRSMGSTRSIGIGLAQIEPEGATFVAYAARHGQTALDGSANNSPFVTALIKNLEIPGLEINLLFRKVRDEVMAMTSRRQEPFVYQSLPGESFYFRTP